MKKYRISLAALVPYNYEVEVEADNGADAIRAAIDVFHDDNEEGTLVEVDDAVRLDLKNEEYEGNDMSKFGGVSVSENVSGSWEDIY